MCGRWENPLCPNAGFSPAPRDKTMLLAKIQWTKTPTKGQASSLDWSLSHTTTLRAQATIVFIVVKSEPDYCIRTKSDVQANLQGKEGSAVSSRGAADADEIK
ncbi:hypothetical protein IFM47457_09493 [Aspergillus lentulus]|nr:hypothetical protein IFM47457_09493 [Aspergillus lentulus]